MKIGFKKSDIGPGGISVLPCIAEKVYRVVKGEIVCIEGEVLEYVVSCSVHSQIDNVTEIDCRLQAHDYDETADKTPTTGS